MHYLIALALACAMALHPQPQPKAHAVMGLVDEDAATTVTDAITAAEAADTPLVLEINSPGGSVDAGFKIAKAIEDAKVNVTCVVDGEAASMAMYILQSCDVRVMTRRSVLMMHEPSVSGMFGGRADDWRAISENLRAMSWAMAEHLAHRSHWSAAYIRSRIAGGNQVWLTVDEAMDAGFVDAGVGSVRDL